MQAGLIKVECMFGLFMDISIFRDRSDINKRGHSNVGIDE
jgi:hypothetical protein